MVAAHPRLHVRNYRLGVPFVPCQPIGLAERDQPLMAIELADDFRIADRCVIVRIERRPVAHWRVLSGNRIEVPVDRIAKAETSIAEEIEASTTKLVGRSHDCVGMRRESGRNHSVRRSLKEETLCVLTESLERIRIAGSRVATWRSLDRFNPLEGLLPSAAGDLGKIHTQELA